ncbi:MAG TPA: hypothetical protein PKM65_05925 [Spirochaetota bacterium]|nr:hypothetical protein [Spirochaetota bacterium]HNT10106.1 hypothetical protein [Spirochaetota bacterium]HNV49228.1 hypothetical protein [Spirochaetota bacterium]HOS39386.1 hypothetical protein [Spirochaetota bacterium]HPU86923.1 hypothetical protein [Spirochaetota bacterium]
MSIIKTPKTFVAIVIAGLLLVAANAFSWEFVDINFIPLNLENISRYNEDRIAYQQIQFSVPENGFSLVDNSFASLLIIRDRKMYLLYDGFDNAADVYQKKQIQETENKLISNDALWVNKIDGKPDYIRITDRKIELMMKVDSAADGTTKAPAGAAAPKGEKPASESEKNFVAKNFQTLYTNVRNEFIKRHVNIFRQLMIDRKESGLVVDRQPLPKRLFLGHGTNEVTKYSTRVTAKTLDEKLYVAEDADGDGVCETFTVHLPDAFNWGNKSGPNIIFIYKNREKDIQEMIGALTNDAYYGTDEEAKTIKEEMRDSFPKEDDVQKVKNWIDNLVPTIEQNTKK